MTLTENWQKFDFEDVTALYQSVNWTNYTKAPGELKKALTNSTSVVLAVENSQIIGLVRSVSDDVSIHYLQDILVSPKYQRKGIGKALLEWTRKRYSHVKIHMLLTDDEDKQHQFYQSFNYKNTKDLNKHKLNAFVRMNGVELS